MLNTQGPIKYPASAMDFNFIIISLSLVASGQAYGDRRVNNGFGFHWDYVSECRQDPFEFAIVLDSSSSIRAHDFLLAKGFLQEFFQEFDIGPDAVRLSVITYGRGIYPEDGFNLTSYNTKEEVLIALGNVPFRAGTFTSTGKGIEYMHEVQMAKDVVRDGLDKVCVVITDGNSQETNLTKNEAKAARDDGITMFAVGVGTAVKDSELLNIAGDEARVTRADNFEKLASIKDELRKKTCIKVLAAPVPVSKKQTCGEKMPTDIYFIFDQQALGLEGTRWVSTLMTDVMGTEGMQRGFQYGTVSGSCPASAGLRLRGYGDVAVMKRALQHYETLNLPAYVREARTRGFTRHSGARSRTRRVAVVVPSFYIDDPDLQHQLDKEIAAMVADGIKVVVADPYGLGIQAVKGADVLHGHSTRFAAEDLVRRLCPHSVG